MLIKDFLKTTCIGHVWCLWKSNNRESLYVVLVRCQVDLGLEIPPTTHNQLRIELAIEPFQTLSNFVQS